MNNDTRMTTTPDDSRFADAEDDILDSPLRPKAAGARSDPSRRATGRRVKEDPRADWTLDVPLAEPIGRTATGPASRPARQGRGDDGDVDGDDVTAYHAKKPTWNSVMGAPTVSQAFSDFDNPYAFQGVPHFALDTAANATSEQLNLALNHHRARFADAQTGRWTTRDPLHYRPSQLPLTLTPADIRAWEVPLQLHQSRDSLDGIAIYEHLSSNPGRHFDPSGLITDYTCACTCVLESSAWHRDWKITSCDLPDWVAVACCYSACYSACDLRLGPFYGKTQFQGCIVLACCTGWFD